MNLGPGKRSASGVARPDGIFDRDGRHRRAHAREAGSELAGGTTWRIDLVVMRVVEDLPARDQAGRDLGKVLEQDSSEREIPTGQDAASLKTRDLVNLGEVCFGE